MLTNLLIVGPRCPRLNFLCLFEQDFYFLKRIVLYCGEWDLMISVADIKLSLLHYWKDTGRPIWLQLSQVFGSWKENFCFTFLNTMGLFQPALKENTQREVRFSLNGLCLSKKTLVRFLVHEHVRTCRLKHTRVCTWYRCKMWNNPNALGLYGIEYLGSNRFMIKFFHEKVLWHTKLLIPLYFFGLDWISQNNLFELKTFFL